MQLVAQQGEPGNKLGCVVLIQTRENYGFVYKLGGETRFEDFNIHSIIARGYWEEPTFSLSPEELERIAKLPIKVFTR